MYDELDALHHNKIQDLVPRPSNANIVGCRWVFKTKLKLDGSLDCLKAKLVAKGFSQVEGLDFAETFSLVIKPATIRLVLSLALVCGQPIKQLDVQNAFLHGDLQEHVYMEQPLGFIDPLLPKHVCKLKKALYGLKQASRAQFDRFSDYLLSLGFICSTADSSLFILRSSHGIILVFLYVDDTIVTSTTSIFLQKFINSLSSEFAMTRPDLSYSCQCRVSTYTSSN